MKVFRFCWFWWFWLDGQKVNWPVGYDYEFGGEYEASVEGSQSIGEKLPIAAMFEPMAIAIIFGLLFATALTLVFVPVMYSLLFRVGFRNFKY